jgi:hypothetical protein
MRHAGRQLNNRTSGEGPRRRDRPAPAGDEGTTSLPAARLTLSRLPQNLDGIGVRRQERL